MPNIPFPEIPSGGAFGYPATTDPVMDQTTHNFAGGGGSGLTPITAESLLANATSSSALPVALAMAASTILARLAAGHVVAATPAQIKTLLAITAGDVTGLNKPSNLAPTLEARLPMARTPVQIGSLWQRCRADDLVVAGGTDGSAVSSWTDTSGGARHLVQATGAAQPILKTAQINGRACVRFAANQWMSVTAALALPYTVFIVAHLPRETLSGGVFRYMWMNGNGKGLATNNKSVGPLYFYNGNSPPANRMPIGYGMTCLYTIRGTSSVGELWRNGIQVTSQAASLGALSASVVGTDDDGVQTFTNFDGDIYEVIICSADLPDLERRSMEQYLCDYYGLAWGTDNGTPIIATPTIGGQNATIWTPSGFNSAQPTPLLLVSHGASQDETAISNDDAVAIVDAALAMGFIVACSNEHGAGGTFAGSSASAADCVALYNYIVANVAPLISRTVTAGVSYGGVMSLLNVSRITNVVGWFGMAPVCDTTAGPTSPNAIANPVTESTALYANKRFLFFASPSDPTVAKTSHTDVMAAHIIGVAKETTVSPCTGLHIDPSHYQPIQVAQFLARCLAD